MTTSDHTDGVAALSAREFNQRIADPDVFCGGGSVAALASAGAAASALLVLRLSHRRKSNLPRREEIARAIAATEELIEELYAAADADIAALQLLLAAQRSAKSTGDRSDYIAALERAALAPITIAERVLDLLEIVVPHLPVATRFTISDLGAAATIAEGAARGALLTAEVNIALLAEDSRSAGKADELRARWDLVYEHVTTMAADVERATRAAVSGTPREGTAS